MDFIEFYSHDVHLSPADQQGNRIKKKKWLITRIYINVLKGHRRGPARTYLGAYVFVFLFSPLFFFVIFNLVAEQLLSRAIYVIIPPQQLLRKCQANYSPEVNVRIGTQTNLWNVWDTLLPSRYRRATTAVYNVRIYRVRPPAEQWNNSPSSPTVKNWKNTDFHSDSCSLLLRLLPRTKRWRPKLTFFVRPPPPSINVLSTLNPTNWKAPQYTLCRKYSYWKRENFQFPTTTTLSDRASRTRRDMCLIRRTPTTVSLLQYAIVVEHHMRVTVPGSQKADKGGKHISSLLRSPNVGHKFVYRTIYSSVDIDDVVDDAKTCHTSTTNIVEAIYA